MKLKGKDRIHADRLWRAEEMHVLFQKSGGPVDRESAEYHKAFRAWAKGLLDAFDVKLRVKIAGILGWGVAG